MRGCSLFCFRRLSREAHRAPSSIESVLRTPPELQEILRDMSKNNHSRPANAGDGRTARPRSEATTGGTPDLSTNDPGAAAPAWTPAMSMVVTAVFAFLVGAFFGQEVLHSPQVVQPASSSRGAGAPGSSPAEPAGASDSSTGSPSTPPHDDATLVKGINASTDPQQLLQMGQLLNDKNRPDLALTAYDRAIKLGGGTGEAYRDRAMMYVGLKKMDEAEKDLRTAIRLDPKDPRSHAALGIVIEKKPGHRSEARQELQKALDLQPPDDIKALVKQELSSLGTK